jgi:hypothetical protein
MANTKKKKTSKQKKRKQFTFTVTRSWLVSMSLLLFLAIVWSFILGILVGRGYTPETVLPEMAGVVSGPEGSKPGAGADKQESEVLKPEELGFFESLQQNPQPVNREAGSARSRAEEPAAAEGEKGGPGSEQAREYAYVYQVGSFKAAAKARNLKQKLARKGMAARVERVRIEQEHWYRIYVLFKGTENEVGDLRTKLVSMGLNNFFLRSKQAI